MITSEAGPFPELVFEIRAARNRLAAQEGREPLLSDAEIRLAILEDEQAQRDLIRRARSGDRRAMRRLAREQAELDLAMEAVQDRNAQIEACLWGRCGHQQGDSACAHVYRRPNDQNQYDPNAPEGADA